MTYALKSIALACLLATTAPLAALAQADVTAGTDGDTSVTTQGAGADVGANANANAGGMGQNGSVNTYGQLVSDLQANGAASTDEFSDFEVGTDGEVEFVALSELEGEGAENGSAALENAMGTDVDADYSQLPTGIFDGTDYTVDDVEVVYIDADGNLVVVVDDAS